MITPLLPASSRSGQGREYPTDRPTEARIRQSARFGHRLILAMLWLDDLGKDINRPIAPSHALGWGDLPGKGIASDKTWCREGLPNSVGQKTLTSGMKHPGFAGEWFRPPRLRQLGMDHDSAARTRLAGGSRGRSAAGGCCTSESSPRFPVRLQRGRSRRGRCGG